MREVTGGFGGCAWTPLAKGRPEPGESERACALREVREELGVEAELFADLAGYFLGTTTGSKVFLMRAVGPLHAHDGETASVRWATVVDARALVQLSSSEIVRARDHALVAALVSLLA